MLQTVCRPGLIRIKLLTRFVGYHEHAISIRTIITGVEV